MQGMRFGLLVGLLFGVEVCAAIRVRESLPPHVHRTDSAAAVDEAQRGLPGGTAANAPGVVVVAVPIGLDSGVRKRSASSRAIPKIRAAPVDVIAKLERAENATSGIAKLERAENSTRGVTKLEVAKNASGEIAKMERAENATSGMATLAKSATSGIAKPERAENAVSGNLPREAAAVRIARIEKQIAVLKAERRDAMIARIEKELTELKGHRGKIAPGTDEGGDDQQAYHSTGEEQTEDLTGANRAVQQAGKEGKEELTMRKAPDLTHEEIEEGLREQISGTKAPEPPKKDEKPRPERPARAPLPQRRRRTVRQKVTPVYTPWELPTTPGPTVAAGPFWFQGTTPKPNLYTPDYARAEAMTMDAALAMRAVNGAARKWGWAPPIARKAAPPVPAPSPGPAPPGPAGPPAPAGAIVIENLASQMAADHAAQAGLRAAGSATSAAIAAADQAGQAWHVAQKATKKLDKLRKQLGQAAAMHAHSVKKAMTQPPLPAALTPPPMWTVTGPPSLADAPAAPPSPAPATAGSWWGPP